MSVLGRGYTLSVMACLYLAAAVGCVSADKPLDDFEAARVPAAEESITTPTSSALAGVTVRNFQPSQRAQIVYHSDVAISSAWAVPDALTILGRDVANPGRAQAATAGGLIAIYLDVVLANTEGRYHELFHLQSACGQAIPEWSGTGTSFGIGADVRVAHFASKLACVLRQIRSEHPEARAVFLDDFGPGWSGYKTDAQRCQARAALGNAFNQIRGLGFLYFVNAGWHTEYCGGWPDAKRNGLADALGVWEHHPVEHGAYADGAFGSGSQFLVDAKGNGGALVITSTRAETDYYAAKTWVGFVAEQRGYAGPGLTVRPPHSIGLSVGDLAPPSSCTEGADGVRTCGFTAPGTRWSAGQSADRNRATRVAVDNAGVLTQAAIYLDGNGGATGTQSGRLAIYADSDGVPGALVATGSMFEVNSGSSARWYTSSFTPTPLAAGSYWIAEHTAGAAGVSRNNGVDGDNHYAIADGFSDGPANPFGAGSRGSVTLSVNLSMSPHPRTYGVTSAGSVWSAGQTANQKRASLVSVAAGGTLTRASIFLDGHGGVSGTQAVRLAIYADANGSPGALVAEGGSFNVSSGTAGRWYTSTFSGISLAAGSYWIAEQTGDTQGVTRNNGSSGTNYRSNPDAFADGAQNPFGTGSEGSVTLSVNLTLQ